MQSAKYKIIFKGEICSGHDPEKVKQDIGLLFKLDTNKLTKIFSGIKVTLKKDITHEQAQKYQNKLKSLGLIVYIEQEISAVAVVKNKPADLRTSSIPSAQPPHSNTISQYNKQSSHHSEEPINSPDIFSFDYSGRYGRLNYFNANFICSLLFYISLLLWAIPIIGIFIGIIIFVLITVLNIRIAILRLHDTNRTGWLALLLLVPVVNFIFHLVLLFVPGTAHTNTYGKPVKQGSIVGLILAIIGSPIMLGFLAAIVLPSYQDYVAKKSTLAVFQQMIYFNHKLDIALFEGKIPILGSITNEGNKYQPLAMAHGYVMEPRSADTTITNIKLVGLNLPVEEGNGKVEIFAVFDEKIARMNGATMSFQKRNDGRWDCIVYASPAINLKQRHVPKVCRIVSSQ